MIVLDWNSQQSWGELVSCSLEQKKKNQRNNLSQLPTQIKAFVFSVIYKKFWIVSQFISFVALHNKFEYSILDLLGHWGKTSDWKVKVLHANQDIAKDTKNPAMDWFD